MPDALFKSGDLMELKPMKTEIENAIEILAKLIVKDIKADDALKFTQAALNLAHVLATQVNMQK